MANDPITKLCNDPTDCPFHDPEVEARVRAECAKHDIEFELTDEQIDFIGAVLADRDRSKRP